MPRQARIDIPGALHHIIGRGIERRKIFQDDTDREDFVGRLGDVLRETANNNLNGKGSSQCIPILK